MNKILDLRNDKFSINSSNSELKVGNIKNNDPDISKNPELVKSGLEHIYKKPKTPTKAEVLQLEIASAKKELAQKEQEILLRENKKPKKVKEKVVLKTKDIQYRDKQGNILTHNKDFDVITDKYLLKWIYKETIHTQWMDKNGKKSIDMGHCVFDIICDLKDVELII